MTWQASLALFWALIILAAIPGPGILVVVSRTVGKGLLAGAITTLGIVSGDFIFIALALTGLSALAEQYQNAFLILKYLGAAYLIFLGISLFRKPSAPTPYQRSKLSTQGFDYLAGLLTTLSNPKAILFYVSFFPAFVNPASISQFDFIWILCLALFSVGGVMMAYAVLSWNSKALLARAKNTQVFNYLSGSTLIGGGIFIASRSNA